MLTKFIDTVTTQGLNVDSIIVTKKNEKFEHFFTNDNEGNIRSISKTVSCLGAGKAIEKGLYSLDTDILPFFDLNKIVNAKNIPYLKKMKIRHLLNLTIGQDKGLMFSKDIKQLPTDIDFLYYILNYDINHEPGTHFVYNNAATYLLCAITQKITGQYFRDWIQKELFNEMGVTLGEWEKSWQGICLGASGLKLKNSDMHKIALLLLNNGTYEGKRLLNKEWISLMNTPQFFTANLPDYIKKQGRCINKMSYGFGLWICGNGTFEYPKTHYFCDGTDGQLLIVSPKDQMVITILSHQKDMNPIYDAIRYFFD